MVWKSIIIFIILGLLSQGYGYAADQQDPQSSLYLVVLWDTSHSAKADWDELSALAKEAVASLKAGDYLEVISADHRPARVRISQYIKSADTRETQTLNTLLANIQPDGIYDADLAAAMELSLKRLDKRNSEQAQCKVVII